MEAWHTDQVPLPRLFDPTTIDLVGQTADGVVQLFIIRDEPWSGSDEELMSLQHKIHNYVSFAVDGQLVEEYPDTAGAPWQIVIRSFGGEPDNRSTKVINQLVDRVPTHGGSLVSEVVAR